MQILYAIKLFLNGKTYYSNTKQVKVNNYTNNRKNYNYIYINKKI